MTKNIHPTAIVDKNAILHDGVSVCAYAIIGANVEIGENTQIMHHASISGHTTIGQNNTIYLFASLGEAPQDKKYNNEPTRLVIGDNNTIREGCTLNIGTVQGVGVTTVGNNNWIMAYVHIAHDCLVGNNIIIANNVIAHIPKINDFCLGVSNLLEKSAGIASIEFHYLINLIKINRKV